MIGGRLNPRHAFRLGPRWLDHFALDVEHIAGAQRRYSMRFVYNPPMTVANWPKIA
jgi:hypothetical protein